MIEILWAAGETILDFLYAGLLGIIFFGMLQLVSQYSRKGELTKGLVIAGLVATLWFALHMTGNYTWNAYVSSQTSQLEACLAK